MNTQLREEITRLIANAALHRDQLLQDGLRRSRWKKHLVICAGILALISASAVTAILVKVFAPLTMQVIAAGIATISGAISLVSTSYFSDSDSQARFEGASRYLALRESGTRLLVNPALSDKQKFSELAKLQIEYSSLDARYSQFFQVGGGSYPRSNIPKSARAAYRKFENAKADAYRNARVEVEKLLADSETEAS